MIFRLNGTIHDMQADGDEEEIAALRALVRMIDGSSSPPPPSPPAGFLGERLAPIATASDADHHVAVVPYRFATDGGIALYVELHETHDGARPGRVMALSTLVHLCQNVGEDEVWQIGGRETPGPRATLPGMASPHDPPPSRSLPSLLDGLISQAQEIARLHPKALHAAAIVALAEASRRECDGDGDEPPAP